MGEVTPIVWLCDDCALALGGTHYEGHLSTSCIYKCDICQTEKEVTDPRDFKWPGNRRPTVEEGRLAFTNPEPSPAIRPAGGSPDALDNLPDPDRCG